MAVAGWKAERAFEGDKILFLKAKAPREGRGFMRIEQKHMLKAGLTRKGFLSGWAGENKGKDVILWEV